jgi:ABC-type sugar transport system permease subunit
MPGLLDFPMQLKPRIPSRTWIFLISLVASFLVLAVSLIIQWLVYDDWLHETGPIRIVGTSIAALVTLVFVLRWQFSLRQQQREMIRRFELISKMNDRIRNALQAIECVTYISHPEATETVRQEVNAIDGVLREVLLETGVIAGDGPQKMAARASRKSA